MLDRRRGAPLQLIASASAAVVAILLVVVAGARVAAQGGSFSLQLTSQRAQSFIDARVRRLRYMPGEVNVKFRSSATPAQQQRALMGVRSRPAVSDLRWTANSAVAVLSDRTQPDAYALASQLSAQPEVEYAEPNFIRRTAPLPERASAPRVRLSETDVHVSAVDRQRVSERRAALRHQP
jgi:hypothetical protein